MKKFSRKAARILISLATMWTFLWIGSAFNRLVIYSTSSLYRPVKFTVTDAVYNDDDGLARYWLIGTVEGQEERLIPIVSLRAPIRSSRDLLNQFPKGTEMDALLNPVLAKTIVQGEILRIRHNTGRHWEAEQTARERLLSIWFIPTIIMVTLGGLLQHLGRPEIRTGEQP
ncbi:MAG: hypothetical protein K6T90_04915 [Leptolyngbyaceae cyanobacterium HOT.MB2.61]|nr:hypothetical protein [Leptolyngbyaceae cyanobacterium HOT.MB2.61]